MPADQWEALARVHGTPFFLLDADLVRKRVAAVREALNGSARVYYAVKANPNLELLRALRDHVDGLDISSMGELEQAQRAGFDARHLSFAGPAKTDTELEAAIGAGVGAISAESIREIDACARIAARQSRRANLVLRINPALSHRAFGVKMGGKAVQFGIDENAIDSAAQRVRVQRDHLDFRGIHVYVGSQCFEAAAVVDATADALRIAREVAERVGNPCRKINFGGGFGVSAGDDARAFDLAALGRSLAPLLQQHAREASHPCEMVFELGRFLSAEAGVYVTRVIDVKGSRGKMFVLCDGGLHHHLTAAGTFGAALRTNFPLRNLSRPDAPSIQCQVAGPSCNPTDLLAIDTTLAQPRESDLIGVFKSGSYALTASPLLFLGRRTPVELVRVEGATVVGRRSHSPADFN
ncbi:MAG TPA: alanine racemase [Casimicrobiaceae bacterium]|nr:alanine racemase [Casimicrobiaceae bacterium]